MNDYYTPGHVAAHLDEVRATTAEKQRLATADRRQQRAARRASRRSGTADADQRSSSFRHLLEMAASMAVGMMVLGALTGWALALAGVQDSETGAELDALLMALNMSAGMTLWMRHRGHDWPSILTMDAAMFVPVLALFPALWLEAISEDAMFALGHVLMLLAMAAVVFRQRHHAHD